MDVDSITLLKVDNQANVAQAVAQGEADVGFLPMEYANSLRDVGPERGLGALSQRLLLSG